MEAGRIAALVGQVTVQQVHLGGGSPTFLLPGQLATMWQRSSRSCR
jgi:coproporphyrinogen III oxidase-like Fe-S oxidoreductase